MSDDIVARLLGNCDCVGDGACFDCEITDEIKRLRGEVEFWHAWANKCDEGCTCLKDNG